MSITDELRKYADVAEGLSAIPVATRLRDIADRIDAEHERALAEQHDSLTVGMESMTDEAMAEHGWVKLPKDADGEVIHFGDVLDQFGTPVTVIAMSDPDQGDCMLRVTIDGLEDTWVRACKMRHHKPTVDDVLGEFACAYDDANGDEQKRLDLLAEYAPKLRKAVADE